jgi:hypothetical protein
MTAAEIAQLADQFRPPTPQKPDDWFDRIDELEARVAQMTSTNHQPGHIPQHNYVLAAMAELNGYNAHPKIVAKPTDLQGTKIYRGITDSYSQPGSKFVDQLRYNDVPYQGQGVYGDGTYFATNATTAKNYANNSSALGTNPNIAQAAIDFTDPNIKIDRQRGSSHGNQRVSTSLNKGYVQHFNDLLDNYLKSHGFTPGTPAYKQMRDRLENFFHERTYGQNSWRTTPIDPSIVAVLEGFDVIHRPGQDYYIVLNRGILQIVGDPNRSRTQPQTS